jgi:protein gp37
MNETGIIWTEVTWNPASGCKRITPGCAFCYAYTLAEDKRGTPAFPNGFDLTIRPHKLKEPFRLKSPTLIFVNSMSDLFWEEIPESYRDQVLDVIEATPQHQYQVLTKRAAEMLRYSRRRKLPSNFWAGVSIEDQARAYRADILRQVDAEIRFISAEPLLGPLVLDWSGIHWCISGGESGRHLFDAKLRKKRALVDYERGRWSAREDRIPWVRSLRDQCLGAGVPYFFKQWGGQYPKSGGRVLDGRTWSEFPRLPGAKTAINKILI